MKGGAFCRDDGSTRAYLIFGKILKYIGQEVFVTSTSSRSPSGGRDGLKILRIAKAYKGPGRLDYLFVTSGIRNRFDGVRMVLVISVLDWTDALKDVEGDLSQKEEDKDGEHGNGENGTWRKQALVGSSASDQVEKEEYKLLD